MRIVFTEPQSGGASNPYRRTETGASYPLRFRATLLAVLLVSAAYCGRSDDLERHEFVPDLSVGISVLERTRLLSLLRTGTLEIVAFTGSRRRTLFEYGPDDLLVDFVQIAWSENHRMADVLVCGALGPNVQLRYNFNTAALTFGGPETKDRLSAAIKREYPDTADSDEDPLKWACSPDGGEAYSTRHNR